jgi:chromosome partitioning protein
MAVVAVVNRKGGSGKSTVAAHIAAWCARQGHTVMLADSDPQQSSRSWLRRRDPKLPTISPLTLDTRSTLRVPAGFDHVVLDTPGGLRGFDMARILMFADAVVMPVCHSLFDRESAAGCLAELKKLPRVAGGRCQVGTVGMRIDERNTAAGALTEWSLSLGMPCLGELRATPLYGECLEQGLTLFDVPPEQVEDDLAQWDRLLNWLTPLMQPLRAANDTVPGRRAERPVHAGRLAVLAGGEGQRLLRRLAV